MSADTDFRLDRRAIRQHFTRTAQLDASRSEAADFLAREVSRRMLERLDLIRLQPTRILDLGCGRGADLSPLAQRYPAAHCIGLDFTLPLLRAEQTPRSLFQRLGQHLRGKTTSARLCADAEQLPLARSTVQMVWSNLMLNWLHDPLPAMREMHRVLEVGGMLMFSTLGPDTLRELRASLPGDTGERVHRFIDMHDLGDCLLKAGFAEPVMDMETITLTYADLDTLLRDIRASGARNASTARPRGLAGRQGWQAARARYETLRVDGRLPATFEIVYGHAWKAAPRQIEDGRAVIQFKPKP